MLFLGIFYISAISGIKTMIFPMNFIQIQNANWTHKKTQNIDNEGKMWQMQLNTRHKKWKWQMFQVKNWSFFLFLCYSSLYINHSSIFNSGNMIFFLWLLQNVEISLKWLFSIVFCKKFACITVIILSCFGRCWRGWETGSNYETRNIHVLKSVPMRTVHFFFSWCGCLYGWFTARAPTLIWKLLTIFA